MAYGLFLGVMFFLFHRAFPQPAGAIAWWVLLAAQLSWGARLTWRRTRLPYATGAMVSGVIGASLLVFAMVIGHEWPGLPLGWAVPVFGLMIAGPVCLVIESRRNREAWQRWHEHMEHSSVLDILLGRHIPDLTRLRRT